MPPPARRIPSYFRARRFSSLTASYRLSATLIILRSCSGDFAFSHRRAWLRERLPTALILLIATDNLKICNVRENVTCMLRKISYENSSTCTIFLIAIIFYSFATVLLLKIYLYPKYIVALYIL